MNNISLFIQLKRSKSPSSSFIFGLLMFVESLFVLCYFDIVLRNLNRFRHLFLAEMFKFLSIFNLMHCVLRDHFLLKGLALIPHTSGNFLHLKAIATLNASDKIGSYMTMSIGLIAG